MPLINFLFRKKQTAHAFAVTLENGREITNIEMQKLKYRRASVTHQNEPMFDILVRVEPLNEPPFEAKMKAGISKTFLLITGVRIQIKYNPTNNQHVTIDDDIQAILARNPQLSKKE
jgi:hypothetical protein